MGSPLHFKSQVEPPPHEIEHELVQVMWQVAPISQVTLPLCPTVTSQLDCVQLTLPLCPVESVHIEPCLHSALHEPLQLPWQVVPPLH